MNARGRGPMLRGPPFPILPRGTAIVRGPMAYGRVPYQPVYQPPAPLLKRVASVVRPLVQPQRSAGELYNRYPRINVPSNLKSLVIPWQTSEEELDRTLSLVQLNVPLTVNNSVENVKARTDLLPASQDGEGRQHFVRVVLFSGVAEYGVEAVPTQHITKSLKFFVSNDKDKAIAAYGAHWNTADGEDPYASATIARTAARVIQDLSGAELPANVSWVQVVEIHYGNGSNEERVVYVVPLVESGTSLTLHRLKQEKSEENGDKVDDIVLRPLEVSLRGLLEYGDDRNSGKIELNLFSEIFNELVLLKQKSSILNSLTAGKIKQQELREGRKRRNTIDDNIRKLKRQKTESVHQLERQKMALAKEELADSEKEEKIAALAAEHAAANAPLDEQIKAQEEEGKGISLSVGELSVGEVWAFSVLDKFDYLAFNIPRDTLEQYLLKLGVLSVSAIDDLLMNGHLGSNRTPYIYYQRKYTPVLKVEPAKPSDNSAKEAEATAANGSAGATDAPQEVQDPQQGTKDEQAVAE